jgi:hypothetical protein
VPLCAPACPALPRAPHPKLGLLPLPPFLLLLLLEGLTVGASCTAAYAARGACCPAHALGYPQNEPTCPSRARGGQGMPASSSSQPLFCSAPASLLSAPRPLLSRRAPADPG